MVRHNGGATTEKQLPMIPVVGWITICRWWRWQRRQVGVCLCFFVPWKKRMRRV